MPSAMNTKHNTRIDEWTFSKAQSFDLGGALGFLFRRLNSLSNAIFAEVSGQQDLTAMQMGILLKVHQAGLITLRDLAERMRVDRSTMQEVVKRMVGRDLLSRRVPPNDRRTHELWLGPIGGQTLARHFPAKIGRASCRERVCQSV